MRLLLATALVLASAAPALAEGPTTGLDPAQAAGLTVGVPLALTGLGWYLQFSGLGTLGTVAYALAPAGFAAGHVYRGDLMRGGLVAAGGYGAVGAGGLLGAGLAVVQGGGAGYAVGPYTLLGASLGGLGYGAWAATDAWKQTSDR